MTLVHSINAVPFSM